MKIGILGCAGRMGKTLLTETLNNPNCSLSTGLVLKGDENENKDLGTIINQDPIGINSTSNLEEFISSSDAIIDFSSPESSLKCAKLSADLNKIHVIGTTGFTEDDFSTLKQYAANTKIVWSSNMSIGVNLLFALTEKVASILDEDYDIDILEMHHKHKVDSPSGTALSLGKAAAEGRNVSLDEKARKTRDGIIGAREKGEIGFATLRGGDVIGDHSVIFAGEGERIEITHKASNRNIYAKGAIRAALWAQDQENGLYNMSDILGLK